MSKKLYDIPIHLPLTATRRKAIDKYINANSKFADTPVSHEWVEDQAETTLRISTPPVVWDVLFHPKKVEVFGDAPLWARLLLTRQKQAQLKEQIELVLEKTGFLKS
jgi:hypothetical protein